jgi:TonB-linked SusC/RagA family outer membrane protein
MKKIIRYGGAVRRSILICLMIAQAAAGLAQNTARITLNNPNISIAEIFTAIKQQTGLTVFYSNQLLDDREKLNVRFDQAELSTVLSTVLKNKSLHWTIREGSIVLKKQEPAPAKPAEDRQRLRIRVTDTQGEALVGVSVSVKGGAEKGVTDAAGFFTVALSDLNRVLVFSYVGFKTKEVPLNGLSSLNVTLEDQITGLDQVVVIGYGTAQKKDVTGAVGQVNMSDFSKAPVKSFDDALAGRVAGVDVSANDGQPGSSNNIIIRGANSITQDNSPLYVIDGFPIENPDNNVISPSDIESIDILKDASATAIYGSRGANGVIIITTKKGKKGDPSVTYNGYYGFQQDINRPRMMNAYEFVKYQLLAAPNAAEIYLKNGKTLEDYKNVKGLDMQEELLRLAPMQNHDLAIRGGTDKTQYAISFNNLNQQGMIINSGFSRYQGRIVLDQTVNDKLKVGLNVNYSRTKSSGLIVTAGSTSGTVNLMFQALAYRPVSGSDTSLLDELYDPTIDGNINADYRINPVLSAKNEINNRIGNNLIANGYLQYRILPNLTLRVSGGINNNWSRAEAFYNSFTSTGNPRYNIKGPNGSVSNGLLSNWLNENTLTYNKTFNKRHQLTAVAGFTAQGTRSSSYRLTASQVPNESLGIDGLDEGATQNILSQRSENTLASFLGRVNYIFNSRYLFTASLRNDGSSKFAPGYKWGMFPSGAFAWRIKEERFLRKMRNISDAKIRLSYGATGNNRVSDFPYLSTLALPTTSAYAFNNGVPVAGVKLQTLGNPNLKWETTTQFNLGIDLGLFKDRISITTDIYRKTTDNLLLNAILPYTTGFDEGYKNIGKMRNQGLEFTLNTVNVSGAKFQWTSSFNISFNSNKVLGLTENQESILTPVLWDGTWNVPLYMAKIGEPVAQFYGLIWDGVYQYGDFDKAPDGRYFLKSSVPTNGFDRQNIKPGDIRYKDLNGDGVVNARDFTVIGRSLPIHKGGFSNNFTYGGFDLNIFFQWSYGNDILNANRLIFEGNGRGYPGTNQYASYVDHWRPDNPTNDLHRPNGQGPGFYSTRVIEDGSYLRLKTISLSYTAPSQFIRRYKMKGLRLYVTAQNLHTWTSYSGRDPDVSTRNSTLTPGFDWAAYPMARTIVFGLNLSL